MTWVTKVPTHYCNTPAVPIQPDYGVGSVWRCDGCGKEYTYYGWLWGWRTREDYAKMTGSFDDDRPKRKRRWWQ
jgi:hypothetical protein